MFTTVPTFIARLSNVEKAIIRSTNTENEMHWLFHNRHAREIALPEAKAFEMFKAARDQLNADFSIVQPPQTFN